MPFACLKIIKPFVLARQAWKETHYSDVKCPLKNADQFKNAARILFAVMESVS
jgi:hypothetical protein